MLLYILWVAEAMLDKVAWPFLAMLGLSLVKAWQEESLTGLHACSLPQQLKQQRDKLRQYQKRVTQHLERERALARQLLRDGRKE